MAKRFDGRCHCDAFRFRVRVERREHFDCHCSIFHAEGMRVLIVESIR